jgi:PII-like signaling protein
VRAAEELVLMRVHVNAGDRFEGRPLYRAIVELLRTRGCAGATVQRAIMGFGAHREIHSLLNELTAADLPLVVECVDAPGRLERVLPELDRMIAGGLVTLERARVVVRRAEAR